MRVCFPTTKDEGLNSTIFGHFGSAPMFVIVDTESGETSAVPNCDAHAPESGCNPFRALVSQDIDAAIVPGIGDSLLTLMNSMGITVYWAPSDNISENIQLYRNGELDAAEMMNSAEEGTCSGAGEHKCTHNHDEDHVCQHLD